MDGALIVGDLFHDAVAGAGLADVAGVLARAECIRDLPARSNHQLELGGLRVHVKLNKHGRLKRWRRSPEAVGLDRLMMARVRAPVLLFEGVDRKLGALAATKDLSPAQPLDDLLASGALSWLQRRAVLFDLARQVAALHDAALHHRDLYLNHVFANPALDHPRVALIDCERVGTHRLSYGRWVVKDLAALAASSLGCGVTRTERLRFLLAYLAARGAPVDAMLSPLIKRVEAKAARIAAHAPRTPVGEAARP